MSSDKDQMLSRVLLIEDCPDTRAIFSLLFKELEVEVTSASDGEEGLAYAVRAWQRSQAYKLILVDLCLPLLNGVGFTKLLRSQGYSFPIVSMTARNIESDKEVCLKNGFNGHISKALRPKQLSEQGTYLDPDYVSEPIAPISAEQGIEYAHVVLKFLNELSTRVATISTAFDRRDWGTVEEVVHKLKMAEMFGYPQLTDLAKALSDAAKQQDRELFQVRLASLHGLAVRIQVGSSPLKIQADSQAAWAGGNST